MPTVKDWEEYVDIEEQYDIEESRKKVLYNKKKSHNKQEWDKLETKLNRKALIGTIASKIIRNIDNF